MRRKTISVGDYEAAERELLVGRARHGWHLHGLIFAIAGAVLVFLEARSGGGLWWPYAVLLGWTLGLLLHYRLLVRYADAHVREQQIRIEWRAGRSRELLHR
jgi:hypothetical protein